MKPAAFLALLLLPLLVTAAERPDVEQLFAVRTVKVTQTTAARSQINYGYVRADASRTTDVSPRFGGYIETLYADTPYLRVKKDEPLARVYSPEVLQAKEDYLTALRFSQTKRSPAMVESVRKKLELLGVSHAEIDKVKTTMKADALTTLHTPASGWVFEKNVVEGSAFKAGRNLFRIVNLEQVWVEAALYQEELPGLNALTDFSVTPAGTDKHYTAHRMLLYPYIDPGAATATLRLSVDNPDGELIPGMYVRVTASTASAPMLTLPRSAVIRKNGGWYVFRTGDFKGIYDPAEVKIRPLDKDRYEILSGLQAGDEVADNAMFLLDADAQLSGM